MEEASSSSKPQGNDQINVCENKNTIEEGQSSTGNTIEEGQSSIGNTIEEGQSSTGNTIEEGQSSTDPQVHERNLRHLELYRKIQKNDWPSVKDIIIRNQDYLTEKNFLGRSWTLFHLIMGLLIDVESKGASDLINELAGFMDEETLRWPDKRGNTVLSLCAIRGSRKASEILVEHDRGLLAKRTNDDNLPVHLAALHGHMDTFKYLRKQTCLHIQNFYDGTDGGRVLSGLIKANLYDVAFNLLKYYPEIVSDIGSQKMALQSLAVKPCAFESGYEFESRCGLGWLARLIYKCISVNKELARIPTKGYPTEVGDIENGIKTTNSHSKKCAKWRNFAKCRCFKSLYAQKLTHMRTVEIVRFICESVIWTNPNNRKELSGPLFTASRLGIPEFVNEFIVAYRHSPMLLNKEKHGIFELAVLHRREKVFNLIHGINVPYFSMSLEYESGNNILHVTGKSGPSRHVPGAALKMQRELQWFKVAENLVHPQFREAENKLGQTPREVFTQEHKELAKEGEKWMKETASSCSVVAALVVTVMFAAAFSVPGGHDSRGIPNLLHEPSFMIFAISDTLALFASITSVLMFLGILTSQYAEEDFLVSLPRMLIIGLVTLFFSIASMMVAFGAIFHISLHHKWNLAFIPIAVVGLVLLILFACLQFPLLLEMCSSTYCSGIFAGSSWRELNSRKMVAKGKCKKKRVIKAD